MKIATLQFLLEDIQGFTNVLLFASWPYPSSIFIFHATQNCFFLEYKIENSKYSVCFCERSSIPAVCIFDEIVLLNIRAIDITIGYCGRYKTNLRSTRSFDQNAYSLSVDILSYARQMINIRTK